MANSKTRKAPVSADIKAGHRLLEELAQLRADNRTLRKANAAQGKEIEALDRKLAGKKAPAK